MRDHDIADGFLNGKFELDYMTKYIAELKQESSDPKPAPSVGRIFYDIVKTSGNKLYIGLTDRDRDGSTSSKRAIEFDTRLHYKTVKASFGLFQNKQKLRV